MPNPIRINGATYNSIDEMPPDVRARYDETAAQSADRPPDDAPAILENAAPDASAANVSETAAPSNADGQGLGPIVVLTVMALGLVAILAIMMFLLFAHKR